MNVVMPITKLLEHELWLETDVKLRHDSYPLDVVSRTTVVQQLTQAGVALPIALVAAGLTGE